mgnify:FL=1
MSTMYTRRTALTALGLGTAALLAACSSKSSSESSATASASATESSTASATASASPTAEATTTIEPGPSMKGEVVLADYSSTGTFEPGTKEHKAVNVPIPIEPAKLRENSVEGLHAFIAYWQATLNYLLLTGDGTRFTNIDHTGDYSTVAEFFQSMYASESGWVIGSERPMVLSLTADRPTKDTRTGYYTWASEMVIDGAEGAGVYSKTNDRVQPLTEVFKYPGKPVAGQIVAHYQDGTWRMVRRAPGTASASPVPSLSPSASAEATAAGSAEATTASAEASAQ